MSDLTRDALMDAWMRDELSYADIYGYDESGKLPDGFTRPTSAAAVGDPAIRAEDFESFDASLDAKFGLTSTSADPQETSRVTTPFRQRVARLIESGQSVEDAERNARRAIAYETGEPFQATREDIAAMSNDEFKAYIAAAGVMPEDELTLDQKVVGGIDLTPEEQAQVSEKFGLTDEDHALFGGERTDSEGAAARRAALDLRKTALRARASEVEAYASRNGITVEDADRMVMPVAAFEAEVMRQRSKPGGQRVV